MIGLSIEQAKGAFFDRKPVMDAMDKATKQALSKFGAFVRTRARSSIRKRKKISQPGQPPSSHTGLLKDKLFFVFERERKGVVIGPARLNKPGLPAPQLLEQGGAVTVTRRTKAGKTKQVRRVYQPRPFMGPAFEKERPKLPELWQNAVIR